MSDVYTVCLCLIYLKLGINGLNRLNKIQSTLVISNPKGLSKILRDICTSIYQICRLEEKINRAAAFNKCICNWTLEVRDMLKILWKRGAISPLFHNILLPVIRFSCLGRDQIFTSR